MKLFTRKSLVAAATAVAVATTALAAPAGAQENEAPQEVAAVADESQDAQANDGAADTEEPAAQPQAIGGIVGIISTIIGVLTAIFGIIAKFLPKLPKPGK